MGQVVSVSCRCILLAEFRAVGWNALAVGNINNGKVRECR